MANQCRRHAHEALEEARQEVAHQAAATTQVHIGAEIVEHLGQGFQAALLLTPLLVVAPVTLI